MGHTAREHLARLLDDAEAPGAFSAQILAPAGTLQVEVDGVGAVQTPVRAPLAKKLITVALPAKFGRGEQTLTDTSVRDTSEITPDLVTLDGPTWEATLGAVLDGVRDELGLPPTTKLRAELHAMLVYGKGQRLPSADGPTSAGRPALVRGGPCQAKLGAPVGGLLGESSQPQLSIVFVLWQVITGELGQRDAGDQFLVRVHQPPVHPDRQPLDVLSRHTVKGRQRPAGGQAVLCRPAAEDLAGAPGHVAVDPHHVSVMHPAPGMPVLDARVPPRGVHQAQRRQVNNRPEPARVNAALLAEHPVDKVLFLLSTQLIGGHDCVSCPDSPAGHTAQSGMPGRLSQVISRAISRGATRTI
jgi:hypothetical protein